MSVFGIPLSFFLPLIMHIAAGLVTAVIGIVAFSVSKRRRHHPRWGVRYLWAYTVVFLTATILSVQHWETDAYLFILAMIGYVLALGAYAVRRWRRELWMWHFIKRRWVVAHIVGMIGSYVILWTAFFVDNADQIPLLDRVPQLTFWVLPTIIALPFLLYSIFRFTRKNQPIHTFTLKTKSSSLKG